MRDGAKLSNELYMMEMQRLGIDWQGGNMMDAYELLEKRSKYSNFIEYSQNVENNCFICTVTCLARVLVGFPKGQAWTKIYEEIGTTVFKQVAFKAGESILRIIGKGTTYASGIQAIACIVRCAGK